MAEEKFEWHLDEEKAQDSMCYDSGTQICSYGTDDNYVQVVIRGYVKVDYKEDRYRHASEMPDELVQMFRDGSAYNPESEVDLLENNWYEIEWIKESECVYSDVFDIGTPATKQELEEECKEVLEMWKKEEGYEGKGTN